MHVRKTSMPKNGTAGYTYERIIIGGLRYVQCKGHPLRNLTFLHIFSRRVLPYLEVTIHCPAHYSRFRLCLNIACLHVGDAPHLFATNTFSDTHGMHCRDVPNHAVPVREDVRREKRPHIATLPHANTKCSNASEIDCK